jgi:hypothetical protein
LPRSSATQAAYDAALLLLFGSEFVCGHGLLAAWRINQQPGHEIFIVDLKYNSKGKLGGEEILLIFRTDPEFRKSPVGGRFERQEIVFARDRIS